MSETKHLPQLLMRGSLAKLPALDLPQNMAIRPFANGDEDTWNTIIEKSFEQRFGFDEMMRTDPAYHADNILFIEVDGIPAATASAWYKGGFGEDVGYIHMVGCLPDFRGLHLGYLVSLAAMYKLRENGFTDVVLHTDDFRIAALKTYLRLGFEIDLAAHESIPERWEKIKPLLGLA